MGKIIAVTNQKGGVGKTTTVVNIAAGVGLLGKKVLIVDIDPQGNATSGYGISKREGLKSVYDVLIGSCKPQEAIIKTQFENVDIIPSSLNLAGAEIELVAVEGREAVLKKSLSLLRDNYDFIFIDCPPSLGIITLNALCACDTILIPIQCEFYALEGLSQLISTVRQIKRLYNPSIDIEGVLLTMYDSRLNLTNQVVAEIKNFFSKKIYTTVIPRNVRLCEAPSFGMPVYYYDRNSKGSIAYVELSKELVKQN